MQLIFKRKEKRVTLTVSVNRPLVLITDTDCYIA